MSTIAVRSRESIFYHPRGITAATIVLVILWAVIQWNLSALVFLGVAILFVIGLKNPLWAVAAILISQMTITSYMISTPLVDISLRLLLLLITLYVIRGSLAREEADLGPNARKLIIPMVILIVIGFISNIVNPTTFETVFRDFRNMFVGLLFIILLPAIIKNPRQLKFILSIILIVAIASSIIGVFQHYNILGMSHATILVPGVSDNTTNTANTTLTNTLVDLSRVPGMGETELELAYILPVIIVVILTLFFTRGISSAHRKLLFLPMIPILLALYFTYTRSALFALGVGVISIFMFMLIRIRWEIILLIMVVLILMTQVLGIFQETYLGGRSETGQEESSVARGILTQAGTAIALDNPIFGIGAERFTEVSPQYAYKVDPILIAYETDRYFSYTTLGEDEPHNDFIMMWLTHGTPALIVYILLYFIMFYNLMYSFRNSNNRFIKGVSVGLAAGLITYIVNSFYHNLLVTLPLLWIMAGFTLVTAKLAAKEKRTV
jgi:O-antigen ligase